MPAVDEAGPAAPASLRVAEEVTFVEAARGQATGRRQQLKLIDAGWGSSGYYSREVLQQAAADRVFPAGMHMYLNHPTATEEAERPERSVLDLAAVLATDATYRDGALWAEAQVFEPFPQVLKERKDHIGVSIRATGTAESGEVAGQHGMIITGLTEGISVDFVTHAGRGGQIVEILESARSQQLREARNIGCWLESRLHAQFTGLTDEMYGDGRLTREERIALSSAIGDALTAFTQRVEADQPQLYSRDLYDGPPEPEPAAMAETTPVPDGPPPAKPLEETRMSGPQTGAPNGGATELSEADRLRTELEDTRRQLNEANLQLAKVGDNARELTDTKAALEEARRENLRLRANDAARDRALATLAESTIPKVAHERVVAAVTGSNVPLTEGGALDEAALTKGLEQAIEDERRYLARFAEAEGMGQVRGLGSASDGPSGEQLDKDLAEALAGLGMSESAAKLAVNGRG